METILVVIYIAAGIWAANRTVYANKILFGSIMNIWLRKFMVALVFGWALIPVAVIKMILLKKSSDE